MLKPLGSGKMKRYPANTRVNPLKNDDPQVAAAISARMTAYTNEMESQHSIDSLRTVLKIFIRQSKHSRRSLRLRAVGGRGNSACALRKPGFKRL